MANHYLSKAAQYYKDLDVLYYQEIYMYVIDSCKQDSSVFMYISF